MGGINVPRWIGGGVVAALVIYLIEWFMAAKVWGAAVSARLTELGLMADMSSSAFLSYAVLCLLVGLVLIFFYAAARTRFGPGVRTAVIVSIAMFLGGYVPGLIDHHVIGLYPDDMLVKWGLQGLIETVIAGVAGAWVYKE
ncbi:MAG TPA: hypothetical protein VEZ88_01920 [Steroidobacteraceae bacterium]|nr:hypothetical protein [Steroidobacteraceae bacterium]